MEEVQRNDAISPQYESAQLPAVSSSVKYKRPSNDLTIIRAVSSVSNTEPVKPHQMD